MAQYDNGLETKEHILDCCRILFYEKGYKKTTFKEISSVTGINQGSIYYHFKKKENIGKSIFTEMMRQGYDIAEQLIGESCTPLERYILADYIYWHFFFKDPCFRLFSVEFNIENTMTIEEFYHDLFEYIHLPLPEKNFQYEKGKNAFNLSLISLFATSIKMSIEVAANINGFELDEIIAFDTAFALDFLKLGTESAESILKKTRDIYQKTHFYNDHFKIFV